MKRPFLATGHEVVSRENKKAEKAFEEREKAEKAEKALKKAADKGVSDVKGDNNKKPISEDQVDSKKNSRKQEGPSKKTFKREEGSADGKK
jgi:hypothetical protein